jgi:hypothetical protein
MMKWPGGEEEETKRRKREGRRRKAHKNVKELDFYCFGSMEDNPGKKDEKLYKYK